MKENLQTILGAGGAIGIPLASALLSYTENIRLVSRKPEKVNPTDVLMAADLLNSRQADRAIAGSAVVYLCVGLEYRYRAWRKKWPVIVKNVISSCEAEGAKLVFFDNMYMYSAQAMTNIQEDSLIDPPSKKGKIRAELARLITDRVRKGALIALITRSADFYGPRVVNSMLTQSVIEPMRRKKKADWLGSARYKHAFTYVPDAAKATALLGNTQEAYGQVWHLPTAANPWTGKEWIEQIAAGLHAPADYRELSRPLLWLAGIFSPTLRELPEMMYQYDRPYIFNSEKFHAHFVLKPTPYQEGLRETLLDH